MQARGDGDEEAERALLLTVGKARGKRLMESVRVLEPFRRRRGLPVARSVEDDGATGPLGDLERGDRRLVEVDPGTEPRMAGEADLIVLVQARRHVGEPVVDEGEDVGDLDLGVEEEEVASAQVRGESLDGGGTAAGLLPRLLSSRRVIT